MTEIQNQNRHRPGLSADPQLWVVNRVGGFYFGASAMAGDWIKMRHDLCDDAAIFTILAETDCIDMDHVIGKLWRIWSWADRHTTNGLSGVSYDWIDAYLDAPGFAKAMASCGWLALRGRYARFPKFSRHMSKSAKKRALAAQRQAEFRDRNSNAPSNAGTSLGALPEKRREEKKRKEKEMQKGSFSIADMDLERKTPGSSSLSAGLDLERKKP